MMRLPPLSSRAQGRWRAILPQLGISPSFLTGRHTACPSCGGRDRFRFDDKDGRGSFYCSGCGAGDGIQLVMRVNGIDFAEAARRIEEHIGSAPVEARKPERSESEIRHALNRLWAASEPVRDGDPVSTYLTARVGPLRPPKTLRTAERVFYHGEPVSWHPCMVAMVHGADGKPATLHRTYLTHDGHKAAVPSPRRLMPGSVEKGAAIRLHEPGPVLGIAEGIETALSASKLFGVPCWAAVNATMLAAWVPPEGVREVVVFGDNDSGFAGQAAAYQLAQRIRASGVLARVEIPSEIDTDFNDVWRAQSRVEQGV